MIGRRVLLIGMMGSGKTSVGREIQARTGWPYVDNDEAVLRDTGLPTRELHEQRGTDALRAAESHVMHAALVAPPPYVAGIAAGVVESPADVAALKAAGPARQAWGLESLERAIPRAHMAVTTADGTPAGEVTSGTFSPTRKVGIALALLDRAVVDGDEVLVDVRGRPARFRVVRPPFVTSSTRTS